MRRNELLWWNDCIILTFYFISFLRLFLFTTFVNQVFWLNALWLYCLYISIFVNCVIGSISANCESHSRFCKCRACFAAKNFILLDQDWADHAVTNFCGDVVMNQWSIVFYLILMAFQNVVIIDLQYPTCKIIFYLISAEECPVIITFLTSLSIYINLC